MGVAVSIGLCVLGVALSTASALILARSNRIEARVDKLYSEIADLRVLLADEYLRKGDYFVGVIDVGRKLDSIQKGLEEVLSGEGLK